MICPCLLWYQIFDLSFDFISNAHYFSLYYFGFPKSLQHTFHLYFILVQNIVIHYLGDIIHEKGCKERITATIKTRTNGLVGKREEKLQVSGTALMGGNGNSLAATKLFEAQN